MKPIIIAFTLALGLMAGPALAQGSAPAFDLTTLSDEQRDALVAILSGLPRQ
jgi:hypothetical protein